MSKRGSYDRRPAKTSLSDGLKANSPPAHDASTKLKGGSVEDGAMRKDTAKTPASLGPRTA